MNKSRLEHLLKEHHRDAFIWAGQCCNYDYEEAKEVLQQTYLKIFEKKAVYKERAAFKTWLFSVIRFTAIDHIKKKSTFESLDRLNIVVEEQIEADQVNYRKLLSHLPERQQQVLLLSFYHGMTLAEIAEITKLHIGTVRTHYERGKDSLRTLILKKRNEQI
ncbi:sigma-70 family RNA polymerase sigma factor [Leptobacterium flavescens]|uniref:Sigma-70 family RNA polymerase sigma factor n=1 Tax=Leptobacterium flavescens TaxID=472055 RepID=A0A6P0UQF0_9FLAO|nr:sigma-70 family RNA polymerase sigma factor [Leptobacterium flavescens]NER12626.1 sigma-70 family RNA polymerase sigma factor [Leptobacterium flavescens]